MSNNLRTRAREAADEWVDSAPDHIERWTRCHEIDGFIAGALWHADQQPNRDQIAQAMYEHDEVLENDGVLTCACGELIDGGDMDADHASHLADAVLELLNGEDR